ncbi:MAG: TRAP transporter small permease [Proteobacteria bacterium]|nr:TRAP transporter small permease [Pseudomonadota bacterium]
MKILNALTWLEDQLPGMLLAIMTCLVVIDVTGRYIFNWSFAGGAELATALFVWLVFLGSASAFRKFQHIGIAGITDWLPPKVLVAVNFVITLMIITVSAYIAKISFNLSNASWDREIDMVGIPYFYVYIVIPLSFVLIAAHAIRQAVDLIRNGTHAQAMAGRLSQDGDI